jgi:hypothetical protein
MTERPLHTFMERFESWADLRITIHPFPWTWRLSWYQDDEDKFYIEFNVGPLNVTYFPWDRHPPAPLSYILVPTQAQGNTLTVSVVEVDPDDPRRDSTYSITGA